MTMLKPLALCACFVLLLCAKIGPEATPTMGLFSEAAAGLFIAPVRHAAVATAVVASTSANASAAAAANANAAAAAAAAAAKPPPAAAAAGPPPVGTMTTTLPPGCVPTTLNNVEYQRCGSTYYRAAMQGNTLVFMVSQP